MATLLHLKGFEFKDLFQNSGLQRLDTAFIADLQRKDPACYDTLTAYRCGNHGSQTSEFLINLARYLEEFLGDLFNINDALKLSQTQTLSHNPVSVFKKYYVLRHAKKRISKAATYLDFAALNQWLQQELMQAPLKAPDEELSVALLGNYYLQEPEAFKVEIEKLIQWCVQAMNSEEGQAHVKHWSSFRIPQRLDFENLVSTVALLEDKLQRKTVLAEKYKQRDGFQLTDPRMDARDAQNEINYCIYCHDHDGDFCSRGFPEKKGDPNQGLKKNLLNVILAGCPLDEKISEMHILKRDGYTLAALAMIMVDNPMCPATGHRICNDCMKACIYQKQDPVNIPQTETRILTDVLDLPWGVEIYDLLTRWNPLRQLQWIMKPYNGLKIMIAGMGPAGFTLAHHLLLEGFAVVGFDGLKIEPLPKKYCLEPIEYFDDIKEELDERIIAGFGGVAEYGITVRWDKNFLKLIYISLMRKPYFQVFGGIRFGGTVRVEDAWKMGFDHFVIAVGAGLPKALAIPGSLAPGMRQANDFLMTLQLGSAAKKNSLTNLQVRLPAVIIGGGLTGIDTATEVQAYYINQVEKTFLRYEKLIAKYGEETILNKFLGAEREILEEFILHGKAVHNERALAKNKKRKPNFIALIHQWGGVTIVYRRRMQDSPAYIYNHEEITKALDEGVFYLQKLEPARTELNQYGHVETLICHPRLYKTEEDDWEALLEEVRIPARSIFIATGTHLNVAYEFEHRGTFNKIGYHYQHYEDENGELVSAHEVSHCKEKNFGPFTSYAKEDKRVTLIGDTHPVFHGNVVKAIASGLRTYPKILQILQAKLNERGSAFEYQKFAAEIAFQFENKILEVQRFAPNIIELTIQAPIAAMRYEPGQFYRVQNFETFAKTIADTSLKMEPLALTCAGVDKKSNTLKFMVIENGVTAKLCAVFKKGDPVALMGPTGIRHKISQNKETVLIMGDLISLALLRSLGKALKEAGNHVIYMGNFNDANEVYCQKEIENIADTVIYNIAQGTLNTTHFVAQGDPLKILSQLPSEIGLAHVDRILLIANTPLLKNFQQHRKKLFKDIFIKEPGVSAAVYSTMQCMLKGVCAQCLQWQIDPETGLRTKAVFACSWPEQPIELIDVENISERQTQNRMQETLSSLWLDYLQAEYNVFDAK